MPSCTGVLNCVVLSPDEYFDDLIAMCGESVEFSCFTPPEEIESHYALLHAVEHELIRININRLQ